MKTTKWFTESFFSLLPPTLTCGCELFTTLAGIKWFNPNKPPILQGSYMTRSLSRPGATQWKAEKLSSVLLGIFPFFSV